MSNAQNTGAAERRFAQSMFQAQYGAPGPINQARPVTDSQNQTAASLLSFNSTARTVIGVITDCTAIGNTYRIQLEKNKQTVVGVLMGRNSTNLFGAREINTLQPGTMVVCTWHEQLPWAIIEGVLPPHATDPALTHYSVLHGATRNRVDEAHMRPYRMADSGHIPPVMAGRPFDATCVGEAGWITETGVKLLIDPFMAILGIEESCQISFHYHDMLARLAAYNFQMWTACREHESFNDQDETLDWTGWAMYPWEQMGLAARADGTRIMSAQDWQIDKPHYSKMEPKDDFMMPWHREREFHGYMGQGGKRCVVGPPVEFNDINGDKGFQSGNDFTQGAEAPFTSYLNGAGAVGAKHPGLFDEFVTADGRLCIQSAKGISLVKRAAIMLPTRLNRPEEPNADNETNYRASGLLGAGAEHRITGDIQTHPGNTNFNRAMGIMDMHAYFFNYAGIHPFFYHSNDYALLEESQADWCDGKSEEIPDFSKLAVEAYIDADDYKKTWQIDHRYGTQSFYTLSCGFELLEDGGVMITDGYGGSIRMTGGSIEISAPGDVWLKSGRNVNSWAGRDLIMRAKNSADISATDRDVRIKAEKNLFMLGGNSGKGGVLIESRGSGTYDFDVCGEQAESAGVIIKSKRAPIATWSPELYLRTGGPDMYSGTIMLDANRGEGLISTYSRNLNHHVDGGGVFWHFDGLKRNGEPSAALTSTGLIMPGNLCLGGGAIFDGNVIVNGVVAATQSLNALQCENIGCLGEEGVQQILDAVEQCRVLIEEEVPDIGHDFIGQILQPQFWDNQKPGNDTVMHKGEFSCRIQADYKTENFKVFEDRWQQLSRITGQNTATWTERAVLCQGQKTYPYPGKEAFEAAGNYIQQDCTIFEVQQGRSKDRGVAGALQAPYANPEYGQPQPQSLNQYTIIS